MSWIYELPSGKLEYNEDLKAGITRELREETNLEIREFLKYLGSFDYLSRSKKRTRQFNFLIGVENPASITLSEHDSYVWITRKDLEHYNLTKEIKEIFLKLFFNESRSQE